MSSTDPNAPQPPLISSKQLALAVYLLYLAGYFTGITAIIGAVIAHAKVGDADAFTGSHYRFQIRTFWIGVLYLVVGVVLTFAVIGVVVLVWWFFWSLVRNVKGLLALNENKPISNPATWMW